MFSRLRRHNYVKILSWTKLCRNRHSSHYRHNIVQDIFTNGPPLRVCLGPPLSDVIADCVSACRTAIFNQVGCDLVPDGVISSAVNAESPEILSRTDLCHHVDNDGHTQYFRVSCSSTARFWPPQLCLSHNRVNLLPQQLQTPVH